MLLHAGPDVEIGCMQLNKVIVFQGCMAKMVETQEQKEKEVVNPLVSCCSQETQRKKFVIAA